MCGLAPLSWACLLILVPPAYSAPSGADLSAAEERGKRIYTTGETVSRRIVRARVRQGEAPVPASIIACIQCHGHDGRGDDGAPGLAAPPVGWHALTDPPAHGHAARRHGRFDDAALARAIREGIDPGGNRLDATMPRYVMTDADMADLIAYLKRIETESDPGLTATSIRIGTVLPLDGPLSGPGRAMRAMLEAAFAAVNDAGGIGGRTLELVVGDYGQNDDPPIWAARDLLANEAVFALVATFLPGSDRELAALAEEESIPLVGPYTSLPVTDPGDQRHTFYLLAGLRRQSEVLIEATAAQAGAGDLRLGVVYPLLQSFDTIATAAASRAAELRLASRLLPPYRLGEFDPVAAATGLRAADIDTVLFLGPADDFAKLAAAAGDLGWKPTLLAPASLAERAISSLAGGIRGRILLAYPTLPADRTETGRASLAALQRAAGLDARYEPAQVAAYAAARVLVEALRNAGQTPSRSDLVAALEALDGFRTGVIPPVTFGESRRLGSAGAHVVGVEPAARQAATARGQTWLE